MRSHHRLHCLAVRVTHHFSKCNGYAGKFAGVPLTESIPRVIMYNVNWPATLPAQPIDHVMKV